MGVPLVTPKVPESEVPGSVPCDCMVNGVVTASVVSVVSVKSGAVPSPHKNSLTARLKLLLLKLAYCVFATEKTISVVGAFK